MPLWGFWKQMYRGDKTKLLGYVEAGQVSDAMRAFRRAFPARSEGNVTLTSDRTIRQYRSILVGQQLQDRLDRLERDDERRARELTNKAMVRQWAKSRVSTGLDRSV